MINPYSMVFINIIASLLLIAGILFYKFTFPKKEINLLVLLILISCLPLISILRTGVYQSGDFNIHLFNTMDFYASLSQGIFIPNWASELNATFGYPLFSFIYPLPYYIMSLYHFMGLSFINSVKLLLISSFIFSGIFMYYWIKDLFGKIPGFVSAVFYLFVPYHLIDMHFRVDVGEVLSFIFLPLSLLTIRKIIVDKQTKWAILGGITIAGLILSHPAISISFIPFIILYALFEFYNLKRRNIKALLLSAFAVILGFLLSSFYWIPGVFEGIYTTRRVLAGITFPKPWELFYSPWRFGFLFQGHYGELSFIIGYVQWLVIGIVIILLLKNRFKNLLQKRFLIFCLVCFLFIFFMMLSISKPIWDAIPLINNFQFAYRLLAIEALFTSAIAGGALVKSFKNKHLIIILVSFAIFTTILNWGNRGNIPTTDSQLSKYLPLSTSIYGGVPLAAPMWVDTEHIWNRQNPPKSPGNCSGRYRNFTNFEKSN